MTSVLALQVLLASLVAGLLLETFRPLRTLTQPRFFRWLNHGLLYVVDSLLVRAAIPGGAVAIWVWSGPSGSGFLDLLPSWPWLQLVLGVLLLDLTAYALHRLSHAVPLLWRIHRVHHTDIDVDLSTGLRHHPLELALGALVNGLMIALAGMPLEAVLLYSLVGSPVTLLSHANWLPPERADRWMRVLLVTPAMHRVHHSAWQAETDSNYGALLSVWDRLFRTHTHAPREDYARMTLGLERFRDPDAQIIHRLLLNPLE